MKAIHWVLVFLLCVISFTVGAIYASEVVYINEDSPTTNNGWEDILQEVSHEDKTSVPYQSEQARDWLVCCSDYAFWRGTQ